MKKFTLFVFVFFLTFFSFAQTVSDFEGLTLGSNTFWDGSDLSGGFANGNAYFTNNYDTTYFSWSGFSYSNVVDTTTAGFGNQNSSITGGGYNGSSKYAVVNDYGYARVRLTGAAAGQIVDGFYITNATFAYISLRDGDNFSKKFGGPTGTDPDWFKLIAKGWLNGNLKNESVEFYLADYRFADSTQDYIVKDWTWLSLGPLGNVDSIQFYMASSDTNSFGMLTPAYFCMDNFTTSNGVNFAPVAADDAVTTTYAQTATISVLANDVDFSSTPLTVTLLDTSKIAGASVSVNGNNQIVYTPAIGVVTKDTFHYKVCDLANSCDTAQVTVNITGVTAIGNIENVQVQLYPNPFADNLMLRAEEAITRAELYSIDGRLALSVNGNGSNININTVELAAGTYVVKIVFADSSTYQRVIKQ